MKHMISLYSDQHQRALKCAEEILSLSQDPELTRAHAQEIRIALAQLSGILSSHLKSEDEVLYPTLITNTNPEIAKVAKQFWDEMGGISAAVTDFLTKWRVIGTIENQPNGFNAESTSILQALQSRIEAEESSLYPLCDWI